MPFPAIPGALQIRFLKTPCRWLPEVATLLLLLVLSSCVSPKKPARKYRLPAELNEASGLVIEAAKSTFFLHNDSGDGPFLYAFDPGSGQVQAQELAAQATDWESLARDADGRFYVADTGNNAGKRLSQSIYRFDPTVNSVDTITFNYPGQTGGGRLETGNYDCEAIIHTGSELHLFTKALPGRRKAYWAYHFKLPDTAGNYEAELVDSLYLPRRVITGAALDTATGELFLIAYNYQRLLGFLPFVATSLISLSDYPEGRFFSGRQRRRNVSWGAPVQYEAVAVYDERYLYIATERTVAHRPGLRRLRRRR